MSNRVIVDTHRLEALIRNSDSNNDEFVKAVGFSVEAKAKIKAPKDLSNLTNSIYTKTPDSGNMPNLSDSQLERVELPTPKKGSVYVGPSVEYGIWQEYGTTIMDAQPYMVPAIREVQREVENNPSSARMLVNE